MQAKALAEASPVGDKPRTEREARKRLGEKRSKRKQPSPVIEDLDVEVEFTAIKKRVELWAAEFSQDDYLRLVGKVASYTDDILSEAGYSDDIPCDQLGVQEVFA